MSAITVEILEYVGCPEEFAAKVDGKIEFFDPFVGLAVYFGELESCEEFEKKARELEGKVFILKGDTLRSSTDGTLLPDEKDVIEIK